MQNNNEHNNDIMLFAHTMRAKVMSWGKIGYFRKYAVKIIYYLTKQTSKDLDLHFEDN